MKSRLLKNEEDRALVSQALQEFYAARIDCYASGINQDKWDMYAELVACYTKPGGRVLELGSGNWRVPYTIYKRGFDVDGCDVWSEDYLAEQVRQMPLKGPRSATMEGL